MTIANEKGKELDWCPCTGEVMEWVCEWLRTGDLGFKAHYGTRVLTIQEGDLPAVRRSIDRFFEGHMLSARMRERLGLPPSPAAWEPGYQRVMFRRRVPLGLGGS